MYSFEENEDPINGQKSCDIIETRVILKSSQQITKKYSWTTVEEGDSRSLKLGQLVKKTNDKAGGFSVLNF